MKSKISYTLKITIVQLHPAIWRQLLVPSDIRLPRLHSVIRIVTGAPDSLQYFFIDSQKTIYVNPSWDDLPRVRSGRDVSLARLLTRPGDRLAYYSGDDNEWEHTIELLEITTNDERVRRAACVAGNNPRKHGQRTGGFLLSTVNRALQLVEV
jgi:hypothetical protein